MYGVMQKSKGGVDVLKAEEDKEEYNRVKRKANKVIAKAKEGETKKWGESLDREDGKGKVFRVVKQMVRRNRDVVGGGCIKDKQGKIVVEEEEIKEVWRSYYEKLLNEEFDLNREGLGNTSEVSGPS